MDSIDESVMGRIKQILKRQPHERSKIDHNPRKKW